MNDSLGVARFNGPRTLVLFPGALGDFICFLPALRALAQGASVDLFARGEFADLAPANVNTRSVERHEIAQLFVSGADAESIRAFVAPYTAIYSWMGSSNDVFRRQLRQFARVSPSIFPFRPDGCDRHQADYYLSCLNCRGSSVATVDLRPQALHWSAEYWAQYALDQRKILMIAPGSGAAEKNWPISYFATVARWWREETAGECLTIFGPVEEERGGLAPILPWSRVLRNLSPAHVAAAIARADIYIGNDSGITHLAAALGVAVLAIFGPSATGQWAPRGPRVRVLRRAVPCAPCALRVMKACEHRSCLRLIQPAEVIAEVRAMLDGSRLDKGGGRDYSLD